MLNPLARENRAAKRLRRLAQSLSARAVLRHTRRKEVRAMLEPRGLFQPQTKPSGKLYRRHPRHREQWLSERMA